MQARISSAVRMPQDRRSTHSAVCLSSSNLQRFSSAAGVIHRASAFRLMAPVTMMRFIVDDDDASLAPKCSADPASHLIQVLRSEPLPSATPRQDGFRQAGCVKPCSRCRERVMVIDLSAGSLKGASSMRSVRTTSISQ